MADQRKAAFRLLRLRIWADRVLLLREVGERGASLQFNIGQSECLRDSEMWVP